MGGHKSISARGTSVPVIVPVADYHVSGILWPIINGNYWLGGVYGGENYYKWDGGEWYIWRYAGVAWIISHTLGSSAGNYWLKLVPGIEGEYWPYFAATGNAIVTAGPE